MSGGIQGLPDTAALTLAEVSQGEAQVPEGSIPYEVQPGDNLWTIAKDHGYGDPPDMDAFYAANPQYGQRNPDAIYPDEVVFVKPSETTNGTFPTGNVDENGRAEYVNYENGTRGEPYHATAAPNGQPSNGTVLNPEGQRIRLDENGEPLNGTIQTTVETNDEGVYRPAQVTYVDGVEVRRQYTGGSVLMQ